MVTGHHPMWHVSVLEGTAPQQPRVSLALKGGAPALPILFFSVLKQSSANLVAPCFPKTTLSYSASALRSHRQRRTHDRGRAPLARAASGPWTVFCSPRAGHLCGSDLLPGVGPLGDLAGAGLGVCLMEPRREEARRRRVAFLRCDPRPQLPGPATPRSTPRGVWGSAAQCGGSGPSEPP